MDLLSRREHAVAELHRKLVNKGFDEGFVDEALAKLVDDGLLSDARYAESYVRFRMNKGFGPVRIREELRLRGVASELVGEYVNFQDRCWSETARNAWQKRFGGEFPEDMKARAKQLQFLQYRGFTSDQTKHIFKDFN
ncbi:Regulatory protein RecX [hydrothermal vent metagenome]|uniref:Regulatory protein RecX n=1 Tax=hydrothermal vent metagenome TaxID=652676 RepID=A0A3B0Z4I9_9ZZZZ